MFKYEIIDGEVTITGIKDEAIESILVPKFIDNHQVTGIGRYAFGCSHNVRNIILQDSIINVGYDAFANCGGLESITIPNSVNYIDSTCLLSCSQLIEINGFKLNGGVNIINNRFIYYNTWIYKIIYQICDDYYYYCYVDNGYFIDGLDYYKNFNTYSKKIN